MSEKMQHHTTTYEIALLADGEVIARTMSSSIPRGCEPDDLIYEYGRIRQWLESSLDFICGVWIDQIVRRDKAND